MSVPKYWPTQIRPVLRWQMMVLPRFFGGCGGSTSQTAFQQKNISKLQIHGVLPWGCKVPTVSDRHWWTLIDHEIHESCGQTDSEYLGFDSEYPPLSTHFAELPGVVKKTEYSWIFHNIPRFPWMKGTTIVSGLLNRVRHLSPVTWSSKQHIDMLR